MEALRERHLDILNRFLPFSTFIMKHCPKCNSTKFYEFNSGWVCRECGFKNLSTDMIKQAIEVGNDKKK